MPTRQQADFEKCLVEALRSANVASAISDAIINNISKRLAEKFNYYDAKISALEAEILMLKSNNKNIEIHSTNEDHIQVKQKVDSLEQRAKNNNIRLMGVNETENENTMDRVKNILEKKLKLSFDDADIVSCYRVNQKNSNRPKHVLITLRDNQVKNRIYGMKKMFKGTGIVMKEDLTINRLKVVKATSEKYGFKNVWTFNGVIYAKTETGVEKIDVQY